MFKRRYQGSNVSILSTIRSSVAKKQRGMRIRAGDRFLRGLRYVLVSSSSGGQVEWSDVAVDEKEKGSLTDFRSLRLVRVRPPVAKDFSVIDMAWAVAGARRMSMSQRTSFLRSIKRAAVGSGRSEIDGWILALMAGVEPERKKA